MIKVEHLSYSFPQKELYEDVSFTIEQGQHCAFLGSSGSGKSTLIDMIVDPEKYIYDGKIEMESDCRIGYVSQFAPVDKDNNTTVFQFIGEKHIALQKQITEICTLMETAADIEPLLVEFQNKMDAYEAIGGDNYESNIKKKLKTGNITKLEEQPIGKLSGGEFKLVQVIKEMLTEPNLIIMDEPDVFLDFENLNSLKDLINTHKGTMIVITHNRYLLNHCFNKILHLENKELQEFDGRYIDYNFQLLQTKIELQELSIQDDEEIARNEVIIENLRKISAYDTEAARGKALYARVKIQERLEARRIKAPFVDIKEPNVKFNDETVVEGIPAITVDNYTVTFNDLLLEKVSFELSSTDKVAIVGANGTGKTTLLRDVANHVKDSITIHDGIELGIIAQHQGETLTESNTIMDEFLDMGFRTYQEVIDYMAEYNFNEESLNQRIGALSGGEKTLIQVAKLCARKVNFLLLDEPTSHLDTYAQLALEKAIAEYKGGILMVSHDFYTIANSMDYVLFIDNKTVRKMSNRAFRKMIYANHFDRDYLATEKKKKEIETRIAKALQIKDFLTAQKISIELEEVNKLL